MKTLGRILPWLAASLIVGIALPALAQSSSKSKRSKEPIQCARDYNPVCTRAVTGILATFTNECTAKAAGAAVLAKGRCEELKCPPVELSVCGRKEGKTCTYANACVAEKDGAAVLLRDKCPDTCSTGGVSVCAVDDKGKRSEFGNACEAVTAGARVLHSGKCLAAVSCSGVGFRVCAISASGLEKQFESLCEAERENASWRHNGKCKPGVFRRLLQTYGVVRPR